jgi:choline dehydrogenase-like flavoprotein
MIVELKDLDPHARHDVCIIGTGPLGLAAALSCAAKGLSVLVLESGLEAPSAFHVGLGRAAAAPACHTPLEEANCRALGGTSHWWGGRCLPFDPIDFAAWPISVDDVMPWYSEAAAFLRCGSATFSLEAPWTALDGLRADQVERWCPNPNMASVHAEAIRNAPRLTLVLGATVTDLHLSTDRRTVVGFTVRTPEKILDLPCRYLVCACGGVQTPRLLLTLQRKHPSLFGGEASPLGRFYMGHIFGKIAEVVFRDPDKARQFDFILDQGCFVRRRFTLPDETQRRAGLLNVSFALGNPRLADPAHCSGPLSMIWLALASPLGKRLLPEALRRLYVGEGRPYGAHLRNVIRSLGPTVLAGFRIYRDKYLRQPGKPAVFLQNAGGRYALHYHSEQSSCANNRLTLAEEVDDLGMPRVRINFRYDRGDAEQVVRAHVALDQALRENGIGHLDFPAPPKALVASVLEQARDGMHQIGATRMSDDPRDGVVDRNCRVHDLDNLYIASTSVFSSSGNANPTFLGVSLSLRLADHLAGNISRVANHYDGSPPRRSRRRPRAQNAARQSGESAHPRLSRYTTLR